MRSREKWVELGEKNQFLLFRLRKKRQAKKSLNKLKDENGDIICEQTKLLKEIKRYYEQLYSSKHPNKESLENYILNTKIGKKKK